jgi:hypothetical protein
MTQPCRRSGVVLHARAASPPCGGPGASTVSHDDGLTVATKAQPLRWDRVHRYSASSAPALEPLLPQHIDRKSSARHRFKEALAARCIP